MRSRAPARDSISREFSQLCTFAPRRCGCWVRWCILVFDIQTTFSVARGGASKRLTGARTTRARLSIVRYLSLKYQASGCVRAHVRVCACAIHVTTTLPRFILIILSNIVSRVPNILARLAPVYFPSSHVIPDIPIAKLLHTLDRSKYIKNTIFV